MADQDSTVHHVYLGDEDLGILDERKITIGDGFVIQGQTGGKGTGLTLKQFFQGIADYDPQALQALVWYLRWKKSPNAVSHISTIDFAIADLRVEEEPDPTVASSGTSDAATSESSPNSAI